MTTPQHPITPPQWQVDAWQARIETMGSDVLGLIREIAQWGADQELEACCSEIRTWGAITSYGAALADALCAARRPKPPSLAEEAIHQLDDAVMRGDCITTTEAMPALRRALERLQQLEKQQ